MHLYDPELFEKPVGLVLVLLRPSLEAISLARQVSLARHWSRNSIHADETPERESETGHHLRAVLAGNECASSCFQTDPYVC